MDMFSRLQRFLIFPGSAQGRRPLDDFICPAGADIKYLSNSNLQQIVTLFGTALDTNGALLSESLGRPHLLYFYGNAMSLRDATWEFDFFRTCGCNVWIPDYAGYGASGGTASEEECRDTADTVYSYLRTKLNVPAAQIIIAGWSLGSAVAIDLASRCQAAGLIALSPFTSILSMVRRQIMLPSILGYLLTEQFDSLSKIVNVDCPMLIGHGTKDRVIPCSMGQELANAAKTAGKNISFLTVEGAEHDDILTYGDPELIQRISSFVERIHRESKSD
jgi:fermentation-respiration switch protein FrsA (DUF1100 family)